MVEPGYRERGGNLGEDWNLRRRMSTATGLHNAQKRPRNSNEDHCYPCQCAGTVMLRVSARLSVTR